MIAHKRTADDLSGPAASRSCLTCATGCVAVKLPYHELSSYWCYLSEYLVTPERHVIVSLSRDYLDLCVSAWRSIVKAQKGHPRVL